MSSLEKIVYDKTFTDKNGEWVGYGTYVTIPNFKEHYGRTYEIVGFPNLGDMYELSEVDEEGEYIDGKPVIRVEPWKVEVL